MLALVGAPIFVSLVTGLAALLTDYKWISTHPCSSTCRSPWPRWRVGWPHVHADARGSKDKGE